MQISDIDISKIVKDGKLKTYKFGVGFIEIYQSHKGLSGNVSKEWISNH